MHEASYQSPIPLQRFEAAIQADQRVLGMLYTGSLGRGTANRFSDLDIEIWLTDDAYVACKNTVRELLRLLGNIQFLYHRYAGESSFYTAFLDVDWQPIDLAIHRPAVERTLPAPSQVRLIKDSTRFLEQLLSTRQEQTVEVSADQARAKIENAIDNYIYLNRKNASGDSWCALGMLTEATSELYTLLAALRGIYAHSYRYTEQVLTSEEQALLTQVWPGAPSQQEIRRAARALWNWIRHVWQETEGLSGYSLSLQVDEPALFAAIDRLYN
ncbi:hypothetical protein EPA93_08730 [Ktedonosporobacter rubrisoli]|uniref:Nucleotidyltransferase domain-containing protein n=1 Tax=Ktedonosporobacter rubrisoli TaxID=2509675 RepID=A0A4P6JLG7_KTERU|nr:hypothetical protein [Ktedonosporobacter rubrisoli]QBD76087.1 hypothetical protein EPA93_08730 [Ktedonosporobacter rubrisoli]